MAGRGARIAAVAALAVGLFALSGTTSAEAAVTSDRAPTQANDQGPVIVVGAGGLRWSDVSEQATPTLWRLADGADLGNVSLRTVGEITCPVDGWLTINTGRRSIAPRADGEFADPSSPSIADTDAPPCLPTPQPHRDGAGASLADWQASVRSVNENTRYSPKVGFLGDASPDALAVGPGAAVALMNSSGHVGRYAPNLDSVSADELAASPLTVIDLGDVLEPGLVQGTDPGPRATQVQAVDRAAAQAVAKAPADARILLLGLSSSELQAHLGLAAWDDGTANHTWLRTGSTRQDGIVQLTDVLPTLCDAASLTCSQDELVGASFADDAGPTRPGTTTAVRDLQQLDTAALTVRAMFVPVVIVLGVAILAFLAWAALLLRRGGRAARNWAGAIGAALAVAPLATCVGVVIPWWQAPHQPLALSLVIALIAVLLGVCVAVPWRRWPLGPPAAACAITTAVLTIDVIFGARLQYMSVFGSTPLVAGRFYGFFNATYSLALSGLLLGLGLVADGLFARFGRAVCMVTFGVVGAVFVIIVVSPALGANVGGTIIAVVGLIIAMTLLSGIRITPRRFALALGAGFLIFAIAAFIDWLRPEDQRAHLGRFVEQLISGEAPTIFARKLVSAFTVVDGSYILTIVTILAVIACGFVLLFPARVKLNSLARVYELRPSVRAGVSGLMAAFITALFVKDSGVSMPVTSLLVVIPVLTAAALRIRAIDSGQSGPAQLPAANPSPRRAPLPDDA